MIEEIDYNVLVENALKNVIKEALAITAKNGLPGDNHFYITFKTTHSGVSMPASLKTQHPEEMTIVLQHQFMDLEVTDEEFSVTLSFSGVNQTLTIPFDSIVSFADPFATFGLQFSHKKTEKEPEPKTEASDNNADDATKIDSEQKDAEENNVVMLDAFRKKNV